MGRTRPPYAPEFRAEAVRLARTSGRPLSEIARDLGCSLESLRHWVKQTKIDAGEAKGLTTDEREELRRLRRENRLLREEREILKKAAAFFARESDPLR
jgi:transposase